MGNDGNEYKIITQVFLNKFINDKFGYEVKKYNPTLANAESGKIHMQKNYRRNDG